MADNNAKEDSVYNDANVKTHDEGKKFEKDVNGNNYDEENNIEIESEDGSEIGIISAAVNTNDDPSLPCLTFRFWVLSTEHVCIAAAATAGGISAFAVDIISIQELFYNTRVNFLVGFLLMLSTQMIGYGLVGLVRKYLVHSPKMIWPQSLVYANMYNTLHGNTSETNDKIRFFYIAFISMFVWQFVPEYMFTWLANVAILCLIAPNNNAIKTLGSVYKGAGLLNFSFNWNAIGHAAPLYTPWWSQINSYIGVVLAIWVIGPLLYFNNVFDAQKFPFLSIHSYDKDGKIYNQTKIINPTTGAHNVTAYENYSPVFLSATFAVCYGYSFMQLPATICHVVLFHGKEVWNQYKKTKEEEDEADIQSELVCGFILPGRPIANIYFKIYGRVSLSQCLLFVQDLKLGHYMKIPPRSMFKSQIWGTFVGIIINYWALNIIINKKRIYLDGTKPDPSGQWTGLKSEIFNTASIVWGLIGPERTFGSSSIYNLLLWGFLIGGFLPIPFYLLHRKFPNAKFNFVNIPVIFHGLTTFPGTLPNFIITGFIVSFLSQFYAFRYKNKWWKK
ncbi:13939_t:CDS:10 [Dentiscutata erythropus]|uniref:13939_t:CDS:1 n=1 Tax=Dentiscutata erythropus TaxID=1348616 RepID=A0A9N9AQV9_9GLOM|nr:13939_t:CDS:10 [Dentiscutata erythropus]